MQKLKMSIGYRVIAIVLAAALLLGDPALACPMQQQPEYHALAAPSGFQTGDLRGEAAVDDSIVRIGEYLLGGREDNGKPIPSLPLRHLQYVMESDPEKCSTDIDLSHVRVEEGVVKIPYKRDGAWHVAQVALKDSTSAKGLIGVELKDLSGTFIVRTVAVDADNPLTDIYEGMSRNFQAAAVYPAPEGLKKIEKGYGPVENNTRVPGKTDILGTAFNPPGGPLRNTLEELTDDIIGILPDGAVYHKIDPATYHVSCLPIQDLPFDKPENKLTDSERKDAEKAVARIAERQTPYSVKFLGLRFGTDGAVIAVFEDEGLRTRSLREELITECNKVCGNKVSLSRKKPLVHITLMRIFSNIKGDDLARLRAKAEDLKDLSGRRLNMELNSIEFFYETKWMHSKLDYHKKYGFRGRIGALIKTLPEEYRKAFDITNLPPEAHKEGPELKDHLQAMLDPLNNPDGYKYIPKEYRDMLKDPKNRRFFEQFILLHDIGKSIAQIDTIIEDGRPLQLYKDYEAESVKMIDSDPMLAQDLPNRDVLREVIRLHGALYFASSRKTTPGMPGEVTPEDVERFIRDNRIPQDIADEVIRHLVACDFLDTIGTHRPDPFQIRVWNFAQARAFNKIWETTGRIGVTPKIDKADIGTEGSSTTVIIGSPLPRDIRNNLAMVQDALKGLVPEEKLYLNKPSETFHISVETLTNIDEPPLDKPRKEELSGLIESLAAQMGPFRIRINGLNLTPSGAIIAQCYIATDELLKVREEINKRFKITSPRNIIHLTLGYITKPLDPVEFKNIYDAVKCLRTKDMGEFTACGLSIVYDSGQIFARKDKEGIGNEFGDMLFPAVKALRRFEVFHNSGQGHLTYGLSGERQMSEDGRKFNPQEQLLVGRALTAVTLRMVGRHLGIDTGYLGAVYNKNLNELNDVMAEFGKRWGRGIRFTNKYSEFTIGLSEEAIEELKGFDRRQWQEAVEVELKTVSSQFEHKDFMVFAGQEYCKVTLFDKKDTVEDIINSLPKGGKVIALGDSAVDISFLDLNPDGYDYRGYYVGKPADVTAYERIRTTDKRNVEASYEILADAIKRHERGEERLAAIIADIDNTVTALYRPLDPRMTELLRRVLSLGVRIYLVTGGLITNGYYERIVDKIEASLGAGPAGFAKDEEEKESSKEAVDASPVSAEPNKDQFRIAKLLIVPAVAITASWLFGGAYVSLFVSSFWKALLATTIIGGITLASGSYMEQTARGEPINWSKIWRWGVTGAVLLGPIAYGLWFPFLSYMNVSSLWFVLLDLCLFAPLVFIPIEFLAQKYFVSKGEPTPGLISTLKSYALISSLNILWFGPILYLGRTFWPDWIVLFDANAGIVWAGIAVYLLESWKRVADMDSAGNLGGKAASHGIESVSVPPPEDAEEKPKADPSHSLIQGSLRMTDSRQVSSQAEPLQIMRLSDIIGSGANNEKAGFIANGSKLIGSILANIGIELSEDIGPIDNHLATAEIARIAERAIEIAEGPEGGGLPPEDKAGADSLKKTIDRFRADGLIGAIIVLARKAQREKQKLIIGLETDWIPGINDADHDPEYDALQLLVQEIRSMQSELRRLGLDNVEIVSGSGEGLAMAIKEKMGALGKDDDIDAKMSSVVIFASQPTIAAPAFNEFRSTPEKRRAFLAGVDPSEIGRYYEKFRESMETNHEQLEIEIMTMLLVALELAIGKNPPQLSMIQFYDERMRTVVFLPSIEPRDCEELQREYEAERVALAAA